MCYVVLFWSPWLCAVLLKPSHVPFLYLSPKRTWTVSNFEKIWWHPWISDNARSVPDGTPTLQLCSMDS